MRAWPLGAVSILVLLAFGGCSPSEPSQPEIPPAPETTLYGEEGDRHYLEYDLSSFDWDYGPWGQSLGEGIFAHWEMPYAYRLGIIDGYTTINFEVEVDGQLSGFEIVESVGHESLHSASMASLQELGSASKLPESCQVESLEVTLKFVYPRREQ